MIDWTEQWELHSPHFKNGFVEVNLTTYGGPNKLLLMKPGPGFGDLSHPTTQLMLRLMPSKITSPVIDVGCGSGVLSFAAALRDAPEVMGIDVDPSALSHARENGKLNRLPCFFGENLPYTPHTPLILMNMISSEQKVAWSALPSFSEYTLIVSGFMADEPFTLSHYGAVVEKRVLEGWAGYVIKKKPHL